MKLSIITVNLNNAKGLQKTIESVITQTFTDYEYIIIDGGSIDGSKEIIEKYADKITYWVSEPDKGIYNGMNKGIKVAKGEYCLFLNSGDYLVNNIVLQKVNAHLLGQNIVYGNLKILGKEQKYLPKLTLLNFVEGSIPHPATFIKKKLLYRIGMYNENYKIVSDWEFFIKSIIIKKSSYKHIDIVITNFDENGISSSYKFRKIKIKEKQEVLQKFFPLIYEDYAEFIKNKIELNKYENSRLHKLCAKIQKILRKKLINEKKT